MKIEVVDTDKGTLGADGESLGEVKEIKGKLEVLDNIMSGVYDEGVLAKRAT